VNQMRTQGIGPAERMDLAPLTRSLGFLLRMAQVQVFDFFFEDLERIGLKPGEFSVLWVIHANPGVRQGVLAQQLRIKRAHMTKMIRSFEDRGLVARAIPDADRRAVELRLTGRGEAFVAANCESFFSHDDRRPTPLVPHEQEKLIALLQTFVGLAPGGCR
jgi:DNA-binding MarR family transcriptional regulator